MATTLADLNAANKAAAKAIWHLKKAEADFETAARALDTAKLAAAQASKALDEVIANLDPAVVAEL